MAKKPVFWEYPLGADADVNELNRDLDTTKGDATLRGLFPILTSTRLKEGGIPPQRKDLNALFKLIGENIYFLQHGGSYEWDNTITYDENAIVMRSGVLYQAQSATNDQDPLSNPGIWKKLIQVSTKDLDDLRALLPKSATTESEGLVALSNEISEDANTALTPLGVKGLKTQVDTLDTDLRTLENTVANLDGGAGQQALDLSKLQSDMVAVQEKNAEQDASIQTVTDGLSTLEGRVDGLANFNADDIKADINTLKDDVNTRKNEIKSVQAQVTTISDSMEETQSKANTAVERVDALHTLCDERAQETQAIKDDLESLTDNLDDFCGMYEYSNTNEYNAGDIIESDGIIYKCLNNIVKAGKPISPEYPSDPTEEAVAQYERELASYKDALVIWEEADTGIELSDKAYWKPLNDTVGVNVWSSDESYETEDVVLYNHKLYECLLDNTNTTPTNANVWKELTSQNNFLGIYAWNDAQTFKAGEVVLVNNVFYKANKQNIGSNPLTDTDAWTALSSGASEGSGDVDVDALREYMNTLPTRGIYAYDSSKSYKAEQIVSYGNYLWKCVNNDPADAPTEESKNWVRVGKPDASDIFGLMDGVYVYDASKTYRKDTIVEYNGNLWKATQELTGVTPILDSAWTRLSGAYADDPVIKAISNRIDDNDARDNQQDTRITAISDKADALQTTVDSLNIEATTQAIGNLQDTTNGLVTRVSNLETANGEQTTAIQANAKAITDLETDLKATDSALDTKLTGIETEFNQIKADTANLSKIPTLETDVQALQTKVQALEDAPAPKTYDTEIKALQDEDVAIKGRLDALENASSGTDVDATQFNLLKGRVDTIEPKVQTLETSVASLDTDVKALKAVDHSQYALKSDIPTVPEIPEGLDELAQDVADTKTAVQSLSQADEALDARLDTLEAIDHSKFALKSEIPEVPEGIDSVVSDVNTLKSDMTTAKTDIANLKKSAGSGSSSGGSSGSAGRVVSQIVNEDDTGLYVTAIANGSGNPFNSVEVIPSSGVPDTCGIKIDLKKDVDVKTITLFIAGNAGAVLIQGYCYFNVFLTYDGVDKSNLEWKSSRTIDGNSGEYLTDIPPVIPTAWPIDTLSDAYDTARSKGRLYNKGPAWVQLQCPTSNVMGTNDTENVQFVMQLSF